MLADFAIAPAVRKAVGKLPPMAVTSLVTPQSRSPDPASGVLKP